MSFSFETPSISEKPLPPQPMQATATRLLGGALFWARRTFGRTMPPVVTARPLRNSRREERRDSKRIEIIGE